MRRSNPIHRRPPPHGPPSRLWLPLLASVATALLLPVALAIWGCDSAVVGLGAFGPDTLDGTWSGRVDSRVVEMTLDQPDRESVAGFGVIRLPAESRALRVEGVRDSASVTLLLEISVLSFGNPGTVLAHYRARFTSRDRMDGVLSGGGFNDTDLGLRREPDVVVLGVR